MSGNKNEKDRRAEQRLEPGFEWATSRLVSKNNSDPSSCTERLASVLTSPHCNAFVFLTAFFGFFPFFLSLLHIELTLSLLLCNC